MIVDTSVWSEFLSTSESFASRWLADRIAANSEVIDPEVVMMELLIGTTDESEAALEATTATVQYRAASPCARRRGCGRYPPALSSRR